MTEGERLQQLFRYDRWASLKISEVLSISGNFKKMEQALKLFAHMAASQRMWYLRVTGGDFGDYEFWPAKSLKWIHDEIEEMHTAWMEYLQSDEWDPGTVISYQNSKGEPFDTKISDILHHLIIHGQHHRAQIAALLRQSDVTPPATDFIFFTRDYNP